MFSLPRATVKYLVGKIRSHNLMAWLEKKNYRREEKKKRNLSTRDLEK